MLQCWALLHENDCYLYEPFWGLQVIEAEAEAGQVETGLSKLSELIGSVEKTGQRWLDAELHRVRGELLRLCDPPDVPACEDALQRAINIAKSQQTKTFELRAAMRLARLWRDQGKRNEARDLLAPVYNWFTEGFDTRDLKEAKTLLGALA